jgi:hypothetical protein
MQMRARLNELDQQISDLTKGFENLGRVLSRASQKRAQVGAAIKAIVIFLGAFVAVRETFNQLFGSSSTLTIVVFAVAGLLIASLTGLEAAFKWETKSTNLRNLATECRGHAIELRPKGIRIKQACNNLQDPSLKDNNDDAHFDKSIEEIMNSVDKLQAKLIQLQEKAVAEINVTYEVMELEDKQNKKPGLFMRLFLQGAEENLRPSAPTKSTDSEKH